MTTQKISGSKELSSRFIWFSLILELVKKGVVLKYRKSHLGILWILIEPMLSSAVYYLIFYRPYDRDDQAFILYILIGRLFYTMLRSGTTAAGMSIINGHNLIKKFNFPRIILPLSAVTAQYVFFLISLFDLIPIFIMVGIRPSMSALQVLVPLALIYFLSLSVGFILAVAETLIRDFVHLWNIVMMIVMYSSAIFFSPGKIIRDGYQWVFDWNPLYRIIELARGALVYGKNLSLEAIMYPALFCIICMIIGISLFQKMQKHFLFYV